MATKLRGLRPRDRGRSKGRGASGHHRVEAFREQFRVGRKLAQARLAKKLTQKEVASRAKVDQGDLSKIERGLANPTFSTLSAVAFAVGYEIDVKPRRR